MSDKIFFSIVSLKTFPAEEVCSHVFPIKLPIFKMESFTSPPFDDYLIFCIMGSDEDCTQIHFLSIISENPTSLIFTSSILISISDWGFERVNPLWIVEWENDRDFLSLKCFSRGFPRSWHFLPPDFLSGSTSDMRKLKMPFCMKSNCVKLASSH